MPTYLATKLNTNEKSLAKQKVWFFERTKDLDMKKRTFLRL